MVGCKCVCRINADHPQGVAISGAHDVISGDRLTLTCKTTSSNPEAEITWYDARGRQLTSSVTSEIADTTDTTVELVLLASSRRLTV